MTAIVRTVRAAMRSGTGTQDFTHIDLPDAADIKGVVVRWSYHDSTTGDGTFRPEAELGMGATDGTRQWCCAYLSEDNAPGGNTDTYRVDQTDEIILIMNPNNGQLESEADGIASGGAINQGWRLNWTTEGSSDIFITMDIYAGTDILVDADTMVGPSTGSTTITLNTAFEADIVYTASGDTFPNDPPTSGSHIAIGLVHNDGAGTITTRSMSHAEQDGSAEGLPMTGVRNDSLGRNINTGAGTWLAGHVLDTFTSTGFDITIENGSATREYGYFAVSFGGVASTWVGDETTRTSNGTTGYTGPGFTPQFVFLIGSRLETMNEATPNQSFRAGPFMLGSGHKNDAAAIEDFSVAATVDDGNTTPNTASMGDAKIYHCPMDGQETTADEQADLQSMDANGWTLDWTETDGTARIFLALALGVGPAPSGFIPYPNPRYAMAGGMQSMQGGV